MTNLEELVELSNRYGSDPSFVLAGGGNTSFKTADALWVKGSGTALSSITEDGFVRMDRERLSDIWRVEYSSDPDKREAEVLASLMNARGAGEENKRPSVETLFHDLFPQSFVLHVHPSVVVDDHHPGPAAHLYFHGHRRHEAQCQGIILGLHRGLQGA